MYKQLCAENHLTYRMSEFSAIYSQDFHGFAIPFIFCSLLSPFIQIIWRNWSYYCFIHSRENLFFLTDRKFPPLRSWNFEVSTPYTSLGPFGLELEAIIVPIVLTHIMVFGEDLENEILQSKNQRLYKITIRDPKIMWTKIDFSTSNVCHWGFQAFLPRSSWFYLNT